MPLASQLRLNFYTEKAVIEKTEGVSLDTSFPEELANDLASFESFNKHLYRPNTYLHKWWARRCGTTFRYILKQLVDDLHLQDFYEPGGLEGKIVLDPMMGGGTILHEAIRMGANVIGADIDPIPYLQAKASLTTISLKHIERSFKAFLGNLQEKLSPFFITKCPDCQNQSEIKFVLYGLKRRCNCGEVCFVDSFDLRQENSHTLKICPSCLHIFSGNACPCGEDQAKTRVLVEKGTRECDRCYAPFKDLVDQPYFKHYRPLVIVGFCPEHGQFFKSPDETDLDLIYQAETASRKLDFGNAADFQVAPGPKSDDLIRNGVNSFIDLFTPRQLLYLGYAHELLNQFAGSERLIFSLLVSTSLEFNSFLCGYKGMDIRRAGAIRHTFSHHGYTFPYTAAENNPVLSQNTSGTLKKLFYDRVLKARQWAETPVERQVINGKISLCKIQGEVDYGQETPLAEFPAGAIRRFSLFQTDSRHLRITDDSIDYVVTDPPYYNSVQYSDLANFFRVWLKLFLPDQADWNYDLTSSAVAEKAEAGTSKYQEILAGIFKECFRVLNKEHGRMVFTFHHWDPNAWTELTIALKDAGFLLVNKYVVFSENPVSVHIRNLKAIKHDCILVLKPGNAAGDVPHWSNPSEMDCADSYNFCRDCGTTLGWFLNSDYDQFRIRRKWSELIKNNGKTSQ